jgi:hypothetical protein
MSFEICTIYRLVPWETHHVHADFYAQGDIYNVSEDIYMCLEKLTMYTSYFICLEKLRSLPVRLAMPRETNFIVQIYSYHDVN